MSKQAPTLGAPVFKVGYEANGEKAVVTVEASGRAYPAAAAERLGVSLVHGWRAGTWRIVVLPETPVTVTSIAAEMPADVRAADAVYLNGYQSWTDSVEHVPFDTMVGLTNVPPFITDGYSLDAAGDYRFTGYRTFPGEMHGFGYGYLRTGRHVALVGSLDEDSGFTTVRTSALRGVVTLEKEPPARELVAGERCELLSFAVVEGALNACVDVWLAAAGVKRRPAPPLVGYSSWYRHFGDIDAGRMYADLKGVSDVLAKQGLGPARGVFQVDDGWCRVGDWTRPNPDRFPRGMDTLAEEIAEVGLVPGLWLAPFLCERDSLLAEEHPAWLLRDEGGEPFLSKMNWSGAYALDTLNPEVRDYVRSFLREATEGWGYRLLKLDFLFAACLVPHGGLNRGQLMADALELVREAVGEETWLDLCGVPLVSAFGRCEYCRIGCDVGLDWDDVPYMRLLHRERISTKWSLANTRARAHLDGRAFRCDPDVYFLRGDVHLTRAQKEALAYADVACGGMLLTSDDMGAWNPAQLQAFQILLGRFLEKEAS